MRIHNKNKQHEVESSKEALGQFRIHKSAKYSLKTHERMRTREKPHNATFAANPLQRANISEAIPEYTLEKD